MNFVKKYLLLILCVLAIVALFLPFATITAENDYASASASVSGFQVAFQRFIPLVLIVGPVALALTDFIDKLKPFKKILMLASPAACIIVAIVSYFLAAGVASSASSAYADVSASFGLGGILCSLVHLAIGVLGYLENKEEIKAFLNKKK